MVTTEYFDNIGYFSIVTPRLGCLTLRFLDKGAFWPTPKISTGNTGSGTSVQQSSIQTAKGRLVVSVFLPRLPPVSWKGCRELRMPCLSSCQRRTLVYATSSSTCCATLPAMAPSTLCCWSSLPTWRCWITTAGEKSVCCVEQFAYLMVLDHDSRWEKCVLCWAVCLPDSAGSQQQVWKVCVVGQFAYPTVLDRNSRWERCVLCGAVCLPDCTGSWQQVGKVCVVWSSLPTWLYWITTACEKSVCCVEQFAYLTMLDCNSR